VPGSLSTRCTGPSRVAFGGAGARGAQDDKSGGFRCHALWLVLMTLRPPLAQVSPTGINRIDKCSFPDPQPAFDALLAFDCVVDIPEVLEVHEPIEFVFCAKP